MTNSVGEQPKPYQPPPMTDGTIRCAACHTPLLVPPIGATAGLCPGLACIQPTAITALKLRDFNNAMQMVLSGRMKAELEEGTSITWLTQAPPKLPQQPMNRVNEVKWYTPEQRDAELERRSGYTVADGAEAGYTVIRRDDNG
jgi:hypothetical protein